MPSIIVEVVYTTAMTPEQVVNELDDVRHRIRGGNFKFDQKTRKDLVDNVQLFVDTVDFLGCMVKLDDGTIVGKPREFVADETVGELSVNEGST
jgi:hypothetical protein